MLPDLDFSLAVIGLILLTGGMLLWRSVSVRQRIARQNPLRELERDREQRSHTPEGLIQEMELRLYNYGREVEGRVETTLHVLDRLIRDAEHEIGRLEEVLQASREVQPEPDMHQRISCLIEAGFTDAEIAACLGCPQETIVQWRQHPGESGDTRVA